MKKLRFYQNKHFLKWCKYNCIVLVFGISLILNIIYISKYFNDNTNQQNHITTIKISAIDTNNKKVILAESNYVTNLNSLGNLLSACPNIFDIKTTSFGRFLNGVKGVKGNNSRFWQIEYWNGKNFIMTPKGIDDTILENNTRYQFELLTIKTH